MKWCLSFAVLSVLAAFAVARVDSSRMPQTAAGDGVLSVAFADAKATISAAMVQKADSYFHGGIDIDCHDMHSGHGECHGDDECHADARCVDAADMNEDFHDPWAWINRHVRAPEKHVHLEGRDAMELFPWLWASVKADPHNVDAWTTAHYIADSIVKDRALAARVLEEAKARNPDSLEIAWYEARFAYDGGKGDVARAEKLLESARELGLRKCGGRLSKLARHDAEVYCYVLNYMAKILSDRGESQKLRQLVEEARATGTGIPVVK